MSLRLLVAIILVTVLFLPGWAWADEPQYCIKPLNPKNKVLQNGKDVIIEVGTSNCKGSVKSGKINLKDSDHQIKTFDINNPNSSTWSANAGVLQQGFYDVMAVGKGENDQTVWVLNVEMTFHVVVVEVKRFRGKKYIVKWKPTPPPECLTCSQVFSQINGIDEKGLALEREAEGLMNRIKGKVSNEEASQIDKRLAEIEKELERIIAQRNTLLDQNNAEIKKAKQTGKRERSREIEVAKRTDTQRVEKQIDLTRLKGSLENWGRIKKVELKRAAVPCSSCERILARVKEVDGKGVVIERDADSLLKKYEGKKVGKEEFGQVEKRVGEVTKGLNDLTSQRKTLIDQYNAELEKARQMKTPERKQSR